jgi:diguanylate cyclase (GGDEF)-like protein
MMTINEIVKETITTLTKKRIAMTPENYAETFCMIAKERGVVVGDCQSVKRFVDKLNPTLQSDLTKYNVNTPDELLTYLVASLNRIMGQSEGKQSLILITLVKRLLQTISLLHNKEARELASASLERIEYLAEQNTFTLIKDKWFDFLTRYDDAHMKKLKAYYDIRSDDFPEIVDELIMIAKEGGDREVLEPIASLIVASLTPSIASSMDDDLATLSYELKNSPDILNKIEVQDEIKLLVKRRIALDKDEVKSRITSLDNLLGNVSSKILTLIDKSNLSRDKIKGIKDELIALDYTKHSFETMQDKLVTIANSLEIETESLANVMQADDEMVKNLQAKVHKLEIALSKAKKETRKDFLTNLISKRGLDEDLNRVDKSYERYGIDYSICFFDLDNFKMLNDTFGHEAGDIVLKYTGEIMNRVKRDVDIFGRYGGEEFMAILPNTDLPGAIIFAEKVRQEIDNFTFTYKGEAIPVTVSVGVANRKDYENQKAMIEGADALLYKAKKAGRNRVFPENA